MTASDRSRVAEAAVAAAAIDAAVSAERVRLTERFVAFGVTSAVASRVLDGRPLHMLAFTVAPREVTLAAEALETAGYRGVAPSTSAAWRAYRATRGSGLFVRVDRDPFRVDLTWSSRPLAARGLVGRLLTPTPSDFDCVALPRQLWPAYLLVRLVRLPARWLRRRAESPDLGPYLQTPSGLLEPLLRFAGVTASDLLVDLGCGDGRIAIAAARMFGCRAKGIETDARLVAQAKAAATQAGVADRVQFVLADASTVALDDADVVTAFLPVRTIEQILPTVLSRMKPGARFVAHEQERLNVPRTDAQMPLFAADGISVAHRWNR